MDKVEILRGPNIKPFPVTAPLADSISAPCSLKVGDNDIRACGLIFESKLGLARFNISADVFQSKLVPL